MDGTVEQRVIGRLAEVLALETGEIDASARLMEDLGAESLDLVELMFLLEQEFEIQLSKQDMSLSAQLGLPEEEIHQKEVLTEKAISLLKERFPEASTLLVLGVTLKQLASLLTVSEVVKSVECKLVSSPQA